MSKIHTPQHLFAITTAIVLLASPVLATELPAETHPQDHATTSAPNKNKAEPPATKKIQNRFATKAGQPAFYLLGMTHARNDLYSTFGVALDFSYYFNESIGIELRLAALRSRLSDAAENLRDQTGLTPDAWPQNYLTTAGLRYSFGYGKILMFDKFVVHFDPQLVFHAGTTFADGRVLPTALFGPSLLTHFKHNIQLKIDLTASFQLEKRARGVVSSFGFAPFIGIGWSLNHFNNPDGSQP